MIERFRRRGAGPGRSAPGKPPTGQAALLLLALLSPLGAALAAEPPPPPRRGNDHGGRPWVVDIEALTLANPSFRAAHWTGGQLQMTVMAIPPGEEIGLEVHERGDQFIRVEAGTARVVMGPSRERLDFDRQVTDDWAIFIPAGTWHNIINVGQVPLKVYVIYAPPEHSAGTLHPTAADSRAEHGH